MYLERRGKRSNMDIPKAPSEAITKSVTSDAGKSLSLDKLVDIQQLKLRPNTPYTGRVVSSLDTFLASNSPTPNSPEAATTNAQQHTQQLNASQNTAPSPKNWIILLQGKLIHVTSEAPLKPDQLLKLMLTQNGLTTIRPHQSGMNPEAAGPLLSASETKSTLNAMNQLLSRQTTLDSAITQLLQSISKTNIQTLSPELTRSIMSLLTLLPNKSSLIPGPTGTTAQPPAQQLPEQASSLLNAGSQILHQKLSGTSSGPYSPVSPEAVKQLIEQSGLGFEHTLSKDTHTRARFIQQLAQLSSVKSTLQSAITPSIEPQGSTPQGNPISTANLKSTLVNVSNAIRSIINNTPAPPPQTTPGSNGASNLSHTNSATASPASTTTSSPEANLLDLIRAQSVTQSSLSQTSDSTSHSTTSTPNVKELLILLSASLIGNSEENSQDFLKAINMPELLHAPFNFPPLLAKNLLKAEAMLADQELTTGQLLKLLAGMINRIQFNQLNSLYQSQMASSDNTNVQSWFFELPIMTEGKHLELFNLRIDKEEEKDSTDQSSSEKKHQIQWRIILSFDFDTLGAIYVQANITPPSVSSTIWANNSDTLSLINREQTFFRDRLTQLGLEVGDIKCQYGQPKTNKAKLDRSLIDINA